MQIGHSTTGKMFWNIDEIKPKERLAYFEKNGGLVRRRMSKSPSAKQEMSCYETCSRIHRFVKTMVGRKLTREQRQHILSRDDPCGSLLENLSLDFLGQFTRE